MMGSPAAGPLIATRFGFLREEFSIGVIKGGSAGQIDAERIAGPGDTPTVQLNTMAHAT